jgi:tripartite-type tricarboxylate transporter receptor subunit TctC
MNRLLLAAALGFAVTAHAQDYPSKAINITVPNPPGGMNQIHAQPLSSVLEKLTKQPAPVINRAGGTAAVGTAYVANQPPDGHNILVTTPNLYLVIEKDKLYGIKSPFSLDQIALLALLSADPLIMVVHPSMPVKTAKELVAVAKSKPNEIVFSSSGPYGITHTPCAMFLDAAS